MSLKTSQHDIVSDLPTAFYCPQFSAAFGTQYVTHQKKENRNLFTGNGVNNLFLSGLPRFKKLTYTYTNLDVKIV